MHLAGYSDMKDDAMRWGDAPKLDVSDRRTDETERIRYTVTLDQYKCMSLSLARLVHAACLSPDLAGPAPGKSGPREVLPDLQEVESGVVGAAASSLSMSPTPADGARRFRAGAGTFRAPPLTSDLATRAGHNPPDSAEAAGSSEGLRCGCA